MDYRQRSPWSAQAHFTPTDVTLDQLQRRFGNNAIYFGGAHRAQNEAAMRIAFNHIPDTQLEEG